MMVAYRGAIHHLSALSENEVREIRTRYANRDAVRCTYNSLAREFDVTPEAIWAVVHRRSWAWVEDGIPPPPKRKGEGGPPRTIDREQIVALRGAGMSYADIALRLRSTPASLQTMLCKHLKQKREGA